MPELLQATWIVLLTDNRIHISTEDLTPTQLLEELEKHEIHWRQISIIAKIPPPPDERI